MLVLPRPTITLLTNDPSAVFCLRNSQSGPYLFGLLNGYMAIRLLSLSGCHFVCSIQHESSGTLSIKQWACLTAHSSMKGGVLIGLFMRLPAHAFICSPRYDAMFYRLVLVFQQVIIFGKS